jgi:hypothetical protein
MAILRFMDAARASMLSPIFFVLIVSLRLAAYHFSVFGRTQVKI